MSGAVKSLEGFESIAITQGEKDFSVTFDPSACSAEEIMAAIEAAGEKVSPN
ncbi:MAG: hypothetical protein P1V81_12645 [Planctomycetota bacterium]|nr:hypothetical protein [Planctomycetota bacterium]